MPGRPFRRCLALAVVGLWLAPCAGALALGLHVALDHHDDAPEPPLLTELLVAAVHGHHHGAVAPYHEHPAHLDATLGLSPGPSPLATAAAEAPDAAAGDDRGDVVASCHRRAPPVPLFHAHCSLLL